MLPSLDNIFDSFMGDSELDTMKCDVYEKDGIFHIEAEVPGVHKEDIQIECDHGYLTITASKNEEKEEKDENKKFIRRERFSGKIVRRFYVGEVNEEDIKASFTDGILKITLPKETKKETKKLINID